VYVEGIRSIVAEDVAAARELGFRIKLLGLAEQVHDMEGRAPGSPPAILQRVHPALLPLDSPMANVNGVLNAVRYTGDFVGPVTLAGAGAGQDATASAVVADLMDIASGHSSPTFGLPSAALKARGPFPVAHMEHLKNSQYFLRAPASAAAIAKDQLPVARLASRSRAEGNGSVCFLTEKMDEVDMQGALGIIQEVAEQMGDDPLTSVGMIRVAEC
jgi:homoserine dehydrogenase